MALLIGLHLALIARHHHTQFPGPGRREDNTVGTPMWPAYALRSLGLFAAVAAVLVLLGGLVQINPVWQWGPYEIGRSTNGAQPDWYLGWLIGALRLMPPLEIRLFGRTLVPNPFFGGVLFPGLVFGFLFALPAIDRVLFTRDRAEHHLLDRARDNPRRTGLLAAVLAWVVLIFFFGSADRVFLALSIPYELQLWLARGLVVLAPLLAYTLTRRWCDALRRADAHPLRAVDAELVAPPAAPGDGELAPALRRKAD
jgi:ubiquinol-cytochrome c reductase cytochrome b subunit